MTDRYLFSQKIRDKFRNIFPKRAELKISVRKAETLDNKERWILTCFLREIDYEEFRYAGSITLPKYWMTLITVALYGIDSSHNITVEGMTDICDREY